MKTHPHRREPQGAVLVTTLIVLTVLAVVAVAFMQSTSMDQLSSRSSSGSYRAQLAADAAVAVARGELARLVARYPDSVTVWQNIGGAQTNEATVLYARASSANPNTNARPGQFGGDVSFVGFPLLSRTNPDPVAVAGLSNNVPFAANDPAVVNLNATNSTQTEAFVGERSMTNAGAPVTAAQWVYIGANPGPTNATNPAVARYAYWMEDESFKVNVNTGTNGARAQSPGVGPADVRLDGSWQSSANAALRAANSTNVVTDRGTNTNFFPTAGSAAIAAGLSNVASASEFRFLTTAHSAGLDLSRGGFKRFNLNTVTNGDKRTALNRLLLAITNTNAAPLFGQRFYRLANSATGINATNAVTTNHAAIYLQKIAANIYDYIDSDDQPTVISNNPPTFTLMTNRPTNGIAAAGGGLDGTNPVAAIGAENVPRLQEYAIHMRLRSMRWDPAAVDSFGFHSTNKTNATLPVPTIASYEIWLDHYFEFWNPGTRDFTNSPDTFLKVFDQPAWGPSGAVTGPITSNNRTTSDIPLIDALTGGPVVFKAGEVTVVTTAQVGAPGALNTSANPSNALVVVTNPLSLVPLANVPAADRVFTGTTTSITNMAYTYYPAAAAFSGGPDFGYDRLFQVRMLPRSTSQTDYQSGVLIGNDQGIIESHVGLPFDSGFAARVDSSWNRNDLAPFSLNNGQKEGLRGGSLYGNSSVPSRPSPFEGDPRALVEQLEFLNYVTGSFTANPNVTRFANTLPASGSDPFANSTFGRPNTNYVRPTNWTDSSSILSGSNNAPLVVRNGPMQSIGELGHITDPARPYITSGAVPALARGGGRTLRVGQSELTNIGGANIAWYSGGQTNASRTWTSWRLADIFTATTNTNVAIPGLINPNGALRDNGAALRAALFGLTFLPAGPDGVASIAGRPANVTNVVTNLVARLTNGSAAGLGAGTMNPLWERGEISELPLFNSSAASTLAGGTIMSNAFDRGREELVRRSIEMITTRGSVFTVYAIGQALQVPTNASGAPIATNVLGTARVKTTFEMTPQFINPLTATNDAFNPASVAGVNQRFSAPTNYTTRVISSTYD